MSDFDKYFNINNNLFESDLANNGMDSIEEQTNQEFNNFESVVEESYFGDEMGMKEGMEELAEGSAFSKAKDWAVKNKKKIGIGLGAAAALGGAAYGAKAFNDAYLDDLANNDDAVRAGMKEMYTTPGGKYSGDESTLLKRNPTDSSLTRDALRGKEISDEEIAKHKDIKNRESFERGLAAAKAAHGDRWDYAMRKLGFGKK